MAADGRLLLSLICHFQLPGGQWPKAARKIWVFAVGNSVIICCDNMNSLVMAGIGKGVQILLSSDVVDTVGSIY